MNTMARETWALDSDLYTAADAGELWRVEDAEAICLGRHDVTDLIILVAGHTRDSETYGKDWILVRACSSEYAIRTAAQYDKSSVILKDLVAVQAV